MDTKRIHILDKTFELSIPEAQLMQVVKQLATQITEDYADKNPVLVTVLNGAFVFAADLYSHIHMPCQMAFTKLASYSGIESSGKVIQQLAVCEDITNRHVIIVEDIVETGYSMHYLVENLKMRHPASIEICALSFKPERLRIPLNVKYVGMRLPDAFIVGYGLDYEQHGRNLRDIYSLVEEKN